MAPANALPEVSTAFGPPSPGDRRLAISILFGNYIINIGPLLIVDAAYSDGPVLQQVGASSAFAAEPVVALTTSCLDTPLIRTERQVWRRGISSVAVLALCLAGVAVLYTLRTASAVELLLWVVAAILAPVWSGFALVGIRYMFRATQRPGSRGWTGQGRVCRPRATRASRPPWSD